MSRSLRNTILSSLLVALSVCLVNAQEINREIEGQILVEKNSEFFTFRAAAINKTSVSYSLRYEFAVFRTDLKTNTTTKSAQDNLVVINSFEKKIVSSVTINYQVEDKIVLLLIIYDQNDKPLGQDRLVLDQGGKTELVLKKAITPTGDGVFLEGVISQKTLTKSGRDFARDFSQKYYLAQIHSPENIFIKEVPGRSRNTLITVQVENQLVWQFFAQPRKEFLQTMARRAINEVTKYLVTLAQRQSQVIRY